MIKRKEKHTSEEEIEMSENLRMVANDLKAEIAELERQLTHKKGALQHIYNSCKHPWPKDVVYKPIRTEAYRTRGDTPGTMGVDFQGPQYIPATETPRWVRICPNCGLEEETRQARDEVKKVPVFR